MVEDSGKTKEKARAKLKTLGIEKILFEFGEGGCREATIKEIVDDTLPSHASRVIRLREDGTWESTFIDPLGR